MRGSNLLPRERPSVCGNCCVVHCANETTSASQADFENVDDVEVAQLLLEVARVKWFGRPRDLDLPIFGEVQRTFLYMSKSYGARALRIYKQAGRWQSVWFRGNAVKWRLRYALGKVFRAIRMWFHLATGVNDGHCNSWVHRFDCRN